MAKGASASGLSDGGIHSRCGLIVEVDDPWLSIVRNDGWGGGEKSEAGTEQKRLV
jgi:hypothetical protein